MSFGFGSPKSSTLTTLLFTMIWKARKGFVVKQNWLWTTLKTRTFYIELCFPVPLGFPSHAQNCSSSTRPIFFLNHWRFPPYQLLPSNSSLLIPQPKICWSQLQLLDLLISPPGTCGGLLSLFMGFSVISAIEIVYAFLLRPLSRLVHSLCCSSSSAPSAVPAVPRMIKVEPVPTLRVTGTTSEEHAPARKKLLESFEFRRASEICWSFIFRVKIPFFKVRFLKVSWEFF